MQFYSLRLVFTSDGVRAGVAIRNVERSDSSDSVYDFVVDNQVKTGSSESQGEVKELNQSQSVGTCIVIGLSFWFCF